MGILSEIGSLVTTTATGGMSIVTKYMAELGVVLVLVMGAFFYGHHVGSLAEKNAVLSAANKNAAKVVTITKTQTVVDTNAITGLSNQLAKTNIANAKLQAELNNLKSNQLTHTQNGVCQLSHSWLDLYNRSLQ